MQCLSTSLLLIVLLCLPGAAQVLSGTVRGDGVPLPDALVRIQGAEPSTTTDKDGHFNIRVQNLPPQAFIAAGHEGFYNARVKVGRTKQFVIQLQPVPSQDDPHYQVQDPAPDRQKADNCGNCHTTVYKEWKADAHSQAATDPLVRTLYDGTDIDGKPGRGPGYKLDWSDQGNCGYCHVPVATLDRRQPVTLDEVRNVESNGVACDVCHKMKAIPAAITSPSLNDVEFLRPPVGTRLNFGPFEDSTFPNEIPDFSYSPLFRDSRLCAPCHDGKSWGVPIYETYTEWKSSEYSHLGVQCQTCHMASTGEYTLFANADKGGKERDASQIPFHHMMGRSYAEFLQSAVKVDSSATVDHEILTVRVKVSNVGAGHDLPTGQPMRNIILLVEAKDQTGAPLTLVSGERVPAWGGSGTDPNDYSGTPGKGFAKVLETLNEYQKPTMIAGLKEEKAEFPAPAWRRTRILTDNRIPAMGSNESAYLFIAPSEAGAIHVRIRLIYRKAFKPLADVKQWNLPDVVLASSMLTVPYLAAQKGN